MIRVIALVVIAAFPNVAWTQDAAESSINASSPRWGDQQDGTIRNPVIWADFNNPEIIRVDQDFYMIWAGHQFMAMPVLHSPDLVNWRFIGQVYDRLKVHSRYDIPGQHYRHGSWAPSMAHHDGKFYVYFCTSKEGLFMSTADDAAGPWAPLHHMRAVADGIIRLANPVISVGNLTLCDQ